MAGKLGLLERALLNSVVTRGLDLRKVSEKTRQILIDFAMAEPPLVEVDADQVSATDAGRRALEQSKE